MVGDVRQMMEQQLMANLLLSKRFRERECLNDIGRQTDETPPIPEFLQWVTERVPQAMQYPDDCVVAIEYEGQTCGRPEAADLPRQIVVMKYIKGT